jgi:hypothetical protein
VVRLVHYSTATVERTPGIWRGEVTIADDFDELTPADEQD